MKVYLISIYLFIGFLLSAQTTNTQTSYHGLLETVDDKMLMSLKPMEDTLIITIRQPTENFTYKSRNLSDGPDSIKLEFTHQNIHWTIRALAQNGTLKTFINAGSIHYNLALEKSMNITSYDLENLPGHYSDLDGHILSIRSSGNRLQLHNDFSGIYGKLVKTGEHNFIGPSGERFTYNPSDNTLNWITQNQNLIFTRQKESIIEEVSIITKAGDTITGSLYIPHTQDASYPTVIMTRGAANYDRSILTLEAEIFSAHGIATFIYDNFGTGRSSGNLLTKDFRDKKESVVDIFNHIKNRSDVNPEMIGLRGGSQGGRIALMAAAELPETAFLILASTPLETRLDQQLYALSAYNRSLGFSEIEIAQSSELWYKYFDNAVNQNLDSSFVFSLDEFRSTNPGMALPQADLSNAPQYPWPDDVYDNGMDYLSSVPCPILGIYGSEDNRVPPLKSIYQLTQSETASAQIILYRGADHSFLYPEFIIAPHLFTDQITFIKSCSH